MSKPSFLYTAGKQCADTALVEDLHLGDILPKKILPTLTRPCDKQTILYRQNFFRAMEADAFYSHAAKLLDALRALASERYHWSEAELHISRSLLHLNLLRLYLDVVRLLCAFPQENEITTAITAYWGDDAHRTLYAKIEQAACAAEPLAKRISTFDVSLMDRAWMQPDDGGRSYGEMLAAYAAGLGMPSAPGKEQGVCLNLSMSNALSTMYREELAALDALLAPFASETLCEPIGYAEELDFYVQMHKFMRVVEQKGIHTCFPAVSDHRQYRAEQVYDPYLLQKQVEVVPNDIAFDEGEPFFFLIGANSGGKTAYLRGAALNLVFALGGCKMLAARASVYCFDRICTHFPKDERFEQMGRLEEEKRRFDEIVGAGARDSFVFLNEAYSGANDTVGAALALKTAETLRDKQMFGLFVTHFQEVCRKGIPTLQAMVDGENNRLYKVQRLHSAASSYVEDILKKYGLDADSLRARGNVHG